MVILRNDRWSSTMIGGRLAHEMVMQAPPPRSGNMVIVRRQGDVFWQTLRHDGRVWNGEAEPEWLVASLRFPWIHFHIKSACSVSTMVGTVASTMVVPHLVLSRHPDILVRCGCYDAAVPEAMPQAACAAAADSLAVVVAAAAPAASSPQTTVSVAAAADAVVVAAAAVAAEAWPQ